MLKKQSKVAFCNESCSKVARKKTPKAAEQIVESPKRDPHSQKEQTEFCEILKFGANRGNNE